jgi:hypothetical protein
MHLDFGSVPGWIGSIGTTLAVSLALYQIATDRVKRNQEERKSQAVLVSGWPEREKITSDSFISLTTLLNNSEEPVHEVVVSLVLIQGAGPKKGEDLDSSYHRPVLSILPPGKWIVEVNSKGYGMSMRPGIEIAFTDRAERHWIRRANGTLQEIGKNAIDYYELGRPQSFSIPSPYKDEPYE